MADEDDQAAPGDRRARVWGCGAFAIFVLALLTPFGEVWQADLSRDVPVYPRVIEETIWREGTAADVRFHTWGVARNAYTLMRAPAALFEGEHCYPVERSLALGEPMISLGLVGAPWRLVTSDPVQTYNLVLVTVALLAAFAMYWLVVEWTGVPAAGIAAGLVFAFHGVKLQSIVYPFINGLEWTVLALLFATRFFKKGGWPSALATGAFCGLQLAGSFYPFLASFFLAGPILIWLAHHFGVRRLAPARVLAAGAIVAVTALVVFPPYLGVRDALDLPTRSVQHFAQWSVFLPGGDRFPGWWLLSLVLAALVLPGRRALRAGLGDPRWAVLAAGMLAACVATGPNSAAPIPNLYGLLSGILPGLDAIRRLDELASGVHLCLALLAGIGAAGLVRRTPPDYARYTAGALVAVTFLLIVRPAYLGLEPTVVYRPERVGPAPEEVAFFETLAARGNTGPILEVPDPIVAIADSAERVLRSAYHHRKTSACYSSYTTAQTSEVRALIERIPHPDAFRRLLELGFTTLLEHHPEGRSRLQLLAARSKVPLQRIEGIATMTAFDLLPFTWVEEGAAAGRLAAPADPSRP